MDTDKLETALAEKVDGEVRFDVGRTGRDGLHLAQLLARITPGPAEP